MAVAELRRPGGIGAHGAAEEGSNPDDSLVAGRRQPVHQTAVGHHAERQALTARQGENGAARIAHAAHGADVARTARCDHLVPDERQRDTLEQIRAFRGEGLGHTAIATRLNRMGRRSARGGKWYASTVKSVLDTAAAAA